MRRVKQTATVLLAGIGMWWVAGHATASSDDLLSCKMAQKVPPVHWIPLNRGDHLQLGPYDALLTCRGSHAVFRATRPFGLRIAWEQDGTSVIGTIGEEHFVTVRAIPGESRPGVQIEVLDVVGQVFYSRDRREIRRALVAESRSGPFNEDSEGEDRRYEDLVQLGWRTLSMNDRLGPWDMIWTQADGRLEVEFEGPNNRIGVYNDVLDGQARPTGKVRFRPNEFWVVVPGYFSDARVNKIIGEVWIATDRARVESFFQKYRTHHLWSQFPSPAEKRAWYSELEERRKLDPGGAYQVWQQVLKESEKAKREWERMLRSDVLE